MKRSKLASVVVASALGVTASVALARNESAISGHAAVSLDETCFGSSGGAIYNKCGTSASPKQWVMSLTWDAPHPAALPQVTASISSAAVANMSCIHAVWTSTGALRHSSPYNAFPKNGTYNTVYPTNALAVLAGDTSTIHCQVPGDSSASILRLNY